MDKFVPAFLPIGTEVSAKYRGAFCEAKVKKALKRVVMKVAVKESQQSLMIADEHLVTGVMKIGNGIEFKHPETSQVTDGVISKITDQSTYTVVFNDGDERTLRRTQLCLKGDKHFEESETLDNLPLSHPEHFGSPVLKKQKNARGRAGDSESEKEDSSSEDETKKREFYKSRHQELVGRVMLVEIVDKRKGALTPVLVVLPDTHPIELKNRDHLLVRSFRDMKYMAVNRKDLKDFSRDVAIKNEDKALKAAFERALLYYDNTELPINWNREELLGPDEDEDDGADESSDDEEQCEEKDRFVAQLYKFMDDRGTPINKGPCIGNKDLNLYRLFRVVQNIGGYNKATNQMKWRLVYSKMGLPPSNSAAHQIKNAYKKYLHAFEDFYRKLGSSMGTISRPGRQSRQSSSRGILSFRDRDKDSSPRSPRTEKPLPKEDKQNKEEEKSKPKVEETSVSVETEDAGEHTPLEESDSEMVRRSTPRREKAQKEDPKSDKKEDQKNKKEEDKKEEAAKEDKKKDDKREERKSLRQSQKEEEKKDEHKIKKEEKEEKKEAKKDEGKVVRVLRKDLNEKEEDVKKEKEPEDQNQNQNQKDAQKKRVTRRKSNRVEEDKKEEDEKEEEEEKGDDKKKEKKDKEKKQPGSTKKEKPPMKKPEEEEIEVKEENKESEDESEEEASSSTEAPDQEDLPLGTKLKVRYGRGRNQKIYEAKIVEHGTDGPRRNYLVHYAGWNTRYDEWVKSDRIMAVVDRPEMTKLKRKSMGNKSPKGSSTPPLTKPETPPVVVKKRGRQPSVQQIPSPGGTPTTKAASSPIPSGEPKTPKGKAVTTASGSASKTRSTRSNSTEIKPDSVTPSTSKHRITRRSSGVGDSVGDFAVGDGEGNFESDMESEAAPPSGTGDITSEREEEEDTKESELDISMEEQQEEPAPPKESDLETKPLPTQEEESSKSKAEDSNTKQNKVESEPQPQSLPLPEMSIPKETSSLPEPALHSVDVAAAVKESVEHVTEPAKEVPQKQEPLVTATEEEKKEAEKKEESTSQPDSVNEEAGAKEEPYVVAEDTASPVPTPAPALVEKPEATKAPPADDPTIPHLKKIDDLPSPNEKKESKEKEKNKFGKKLGRESKKGRQNEMRTSLSEIPTLEPMTTPPEAKQPPASDITPSPYDFNDADVESPSSWQPEITKKWEPSSKPLPLFRDVKMELKKSLETEKKKVKKKVKKAGEEATKEGESAQSGTESPAKLNEKKLKDLASPGDLSEKPPPKKKGRKKKVVDGEAIKPDVSSYEETVNSVVESLKADEYVHIPLPPSLEPKEEKPVKKRKSKVLDSASPAKGEEKDTDISKKEPGKAGKGLKGKVGRKKKDAKASDSAMDHSADPVPLPFSSYDSQNAVSQPQQDKTPSSQLLEPVAAKQPRVEAELPLLSSSSSPFGACAPGFGTVDPQAGPSGLQILSMASIRPLPSTSGTPGSGSGERLAPSLEARNEVVKQAGAEPRADFAGDVPRAPCGGGVGNTVLDNTPPTTPENDLDEANSASSSCEGHDHLKEDLFSLDSGERTSKGGSESPPGCDFSLSSTSSENLPSSSSGVQCGGKPSQSLETVSTKRKQKDDSAAPAKKRKRLASRTTRGDRSKKPPKFGDDDSQSRSPLHQNGDSMSGLPSQGSVSDTLKNSTPRPQKFHFADDLGEYLKGESRIQFLLDKMKEVRKVYQGIKSEIAGIDRKRKRARRREKERESSQASAGERDAS